MNIEDIKPIQIIGTQRSGSNLLRLMLNQMPSISAPHPPHILSTFYPLLDKYKPLQKDSNFHLLIHDVCRLIEANPVKWNCNLDQELIYKTCKRRSLLEIFKTIYQIMAYHNQASFWCCKSMSNSNYFSQFKQERLSPCFIHLIRDGRDVACSFRKILVGEKHPYHLAQKWKSNYLTAKRIERLAGPSKFVTIKYESLISDPLSELNRIGQLLQIDISNNVLNYFSSQESKKTAEAGYMWRNVQKPVMKENFRNYKNEFNDDEIKIFENVAGEELQENGYELEFPSTKHTYSDSEVRTFDLVNEELKQSIRNKKYLRKDLDSRRLQYQLLDELNLKLSTG
ncbi:MAG: sulfotransferase [Ekhidna sp.]|nr:sulfotransferase [Ekhidna sp.]MBC6425831.1 sulfotransferase [Ekhidna sp.]